MNAVAAAALALREPWGLAPLLLAVPLVVLHLHRRRRVVVPFLPLLREGAGRGRPLGGWRRVRDAASLAARLLALAALALALAGLHPSRAEPEPEDLLLVVDADATTSAREPDGRPRLAHALDLARAVIRSRRWGTVSVLAAGEAPRVLVRPTADRGAAAEALAGAGLAPARGTADLGAALALALGRASPRARVVVVSAREVPAADAPPGVAQEVLGVGEAGDDQGIVAFDVARSEEGPRLAVRLAVRNDGPAPVERRLAVRLDDALAEERALALAPGAVVEAALEVLPPRGGAWLRASLEGEDAWAANDRVTARLPSPLRPSVLVVHGGAVRPYVRAILEAMGDRIDAEASGFVRAADLGAAPARDVVFVDGAALPPGSLRPGAWLFLAPLAGETPFEVGAAMREPLVWRTAEANPLVREVDLATAFVATAFPVRAPGARGLAFAEAEAVVAEGERDGVRWVAIGLDPEASDLPVRAALPLLVRNAVLALARAPEEPLDPFYRAGEALRPRLPLPGGPEARVRSEGLEATARLGTEGPAWVVPAGASGEAEVTTAGLPPWTGRTAFVDLDPARTVRPVRPAASPPDAAPDPEAAGDRWRRWLLAAAAALLLLDLALLRVGGRRGA